MKIFTPYQTEPGIMTKTLKPPNITLSPNPAGWLHELSQKLSASIARFYRLGWLSGATGQKSPIIKVGNEWIEVKPLALESTLTLIILLSPHIAKIESHWPEFQAALSSDKRGAVLSALFMALRSEMAATPGDITRAFALLIGRDYEFVARNATASDLINAIPTLDRINDFGKLWTSIKGLGLTIKYQ